MRILPRYLQGYKPAFVKVMSAWQPDVEKFPVSPKMGRWNVVNRLPFGAPRMRERGCLLAPSCKQAQRFGGLPELGFPGSEPLNTYLFPEHSQPVRFSHWY